MVTKPVYPNENRLFVIAAIISAIAWIYVVHLTQGAILAIIPVLFLFYVFAQSGFISYFKGTGALVSAEQFPDIDQRVRDCAAKIGLKNVPDVYILHGNGMFNAFATRFLNKNYIILLSDVLDCLEDHPETINFYIGHEMGHLDRKHLVFEPLLCFALILPLLGAGYSRAREYTCDLYGAACCTSPDYARKGLALLAVGGKRYKTINFEGYLTQLRGTSGFWMSFHELVASYPWLVKRLARVQPDTAERVPSRNPLAYLLAMFIPRLSIMSVIIIYLLFVFGMASAGGGFMKEFAKGMSAYQEGATLEEVAESLNKTNPQRIDDITTLENASVENGTDFVYLYTIDMKKEELDFNAMQGDLIASGTEFLCGPEGEYFLNNQASIVYRYKDIAGEPVGDVVISPEACGTK